MDSTAQVKPVQPGAAGDSPLLHRYNLTFPFGTAEATMELAAYRASRDGFDTGFPTFRHMLRAIRLLFPSHKISLWTKRRVRAFCDPLPKYRWQTWIGPAASGKSTDAAVIALIHWWAAPDCTTVTTASTTQPMLEKRIFGEVVKYHSSVPNAPGFYHSSDTSITLGKKESDLVSNRNGIFGVAVLKGTLAEAMGNIVGVHNRYNVLIVDEMQATREAVVEAASNLSASGEFCFIGMGNPDDRNTPLGRHSEPKGGWETVHPDKPGCEEWDTKEGVCLFFDGLKSPAVADPEGWPFLLNRRKIDEYAEAHGADSPLFWSQRRGFFPPEGMTDTLFSLSFFESTLSDRTDPQQWMFPPLLVAGLDPAFSSGGDRCVMSVMEAGLTTLGRMVIRNRTDLRRVIKLSASLLGASRSGGNGVDVPVPVSQQIVAQVSAACIALGIPPERLALDTTGTQNTLADVFDTMWRPGCLRVSFGGKASTRPISDADRTEGAKFYGNRMTELWHCLWHACKAGQIMGIDYEVAREFSWRRLHKVMPVTLESKVDMRVRTGKSPDIADSVVVILELLRQRFGWTPGRVLDAEAFLSPDEAEQYRRTEEAALAPNSEAERVASSLFPRSAGAGRHPLGSPVTPEAGYGAGAGGAGVLPDFAHASPGINFSNGGGFLP